MKFLEKLLCKHQWEELKQVRVQYFFGDVGEILVLICRKCWKTGKIKLL